VLCLHATQHTVVLALVWPPSCSGNTNVLIYDAAEGRAITSCVLSYRALTTESTSDIFLLFYTKVWVSSNVHQISQNCSGGNGAYPQS